MESIFSRTELLLGPENMLRLSKARVIVFGTGGVGSWCADGLIRSGVGHIVLVDPDKVNATNVNRQLMATAKTIGRPKVEVLKERLQDINPDAGIEAVTTPYTAETADRFQLEDYDYIIDAIDTLKNKILLINNASRTDSTLFSSMGAALKTDPTKVTVSDFWKVDGDPFARQIRKKMRQQKTLPAKPFLAVWSPELMENRGVAEVEPDSGKACVNGTAVMVTAAFGFTLASLVIKDICSKQF